MSFKTYANVVAPQSAPVTGKNMVKNSAGGYAFEVSPRDLLRRFLILGTEGATYYASEKKRTYQITENLKQLISTDWKFVVDETVAVSQRGRAPKNDPALYVLAACMASDNKDARVYAGIMLPKVARTGTHLFHFLEYVNDMRGWGRGLKSAVANWYTSKSPDSLAYQLVKYQARDGWSHRDALRLAHPRTTNPELSNLLQFAAHSEARTTNSLVEVVRAIHDGLLPKEALPQVVKDMNIPIEAIPTEMWTNELYAQVAMGDQITWLLRNLGKLSSLNLLFGEVKNHVISVFQDVDVLTKARIHPLSLYNAYKVYNSGHGKLGGLVWTPDFDVSYVLSAGINKLLAATPKSDKSVLYGLDVSGSMACGRVGGMDITPAEATAILALAAIHSNPATKLMMFSDQFKPAPISIGDTLTGAVSATARITFGGTDCTLPILYADKNNLKVDAFVVLTDNETWAGSIHPFQALKQYRKKTGIDAKMVVVGMVANNFSIADPSDVGSLDVVGFDTATPNLIEEFINQ